VLAQVVRGVLAHDETPNKVAFEILPVFWQLLASGDTFSWSD
jgi:hypothetical protein